MKIIGWRKSLLFKTAGIGFLITAISFALLYINNINTEQGIKRLAANEAQAYFNSVDDAADIISTDIIYHATATLNVHTNITLTEVFSAARREASRENLRNIIIWYIDRTGYPTSNPAQIDPNLSQECLRLFKNGIDNGNIAIGDKLYKVVCRKLDSNREGALIIAFPLESLFAAVDRDRRIQICAADAPNSSANQTIVLPINEFGGKSVGLFKIKPTGTLPTESDLSGWEVILLGLMPLLGFILIGYLLYRYFDSFTSHLASMRQTLKREKPGMEIFKRDHHVIKSDMPELSEIFSLVDESLNDKARLNRSFDTIGAALSIVQEKGYDRNAVGEIVEMIVNSNNYFGGAVFSFEPGDDRVELICKFGFNETLSAGLCQSVAGLSFVKYVQKQAKTMVFSGDTLSEEAWRKLFEGFQHIEVIPLLFKAQFKGLLLLISLDPVYETRIPGMVSGLFGEILGNLIQGMELEREKLARYDKTRILQETSLAISSKLDLPSVLQVVASRLTDFADATYCLILLNTDFENILEVASFHTNRQQGINIPEMARINISELPKVAESMTAKRTLILGSQDLTEMTSMERRFFHIEMVKLLTILPISHSAKSIGAVILGEERSRSRSAGAPDKLNFVQAIVSQAASAIENARLYGFINNKVDQLTSLHNASAAIHSETNINNMLDKVLNSIRDYLHYTVAAVFMFDEKTNRLRPVVVNNVEVSQGTEKIGLGNSNSVSEKAALSGESQLVEDFRVETDLKPSFPKLLSELAVPIKLDGRILGALTVGSQAKLAFTELHENFMRTLAAQIALATERTRLFEQERERGVKLNTIFEFSKKLSKSLNVQEVIKTAADSIREAFGYHLVVIFMLDQVKRRYLLGYQASSSDIKLPDGFGVAENCGLLGAAINSRKTVYCPDVNSESSYVLGVADIKSEVCIPIIVGEKNLGVLDVESMELNGFTSEDISTLEALADIMAVAIDNSVLFEESIQKADRLALLDNINKAVSATLDLDSFFRVVARAVSDNAGYRWTCLVVPDANSFIFKAGYTPKSAGVISTDNMLEMLRDKLSAVIESSAPQFVSFSQLAAMGVPEKLQSVIDAGIRNLALFPIGDNIRTEAVMIVGSSRSDDFSIQELQLLKDLAVHLRIAWQNAQLFKQLKTAYEQLQEAQDRVVQTEKLRALGEMSSGVVHDFNNILAAILGRLQILTVKLDDYEDWSGKQFLQRNLDLIEKAANDGSRILTRIRDFTRKTSSEKFVEVQIDQLINDTIELTRPRWHDQSLAHGRTIDVEYKGESNLQTTGSPTELREVFVNLINNAVDAITGDGRITFEARLISGMEIKITIEDNGSGMSADIRKRIFEPLFTTKGAGGTGLGLSVTYGIITRHKGTIDVDSKLGRGTKFTIVIPVRMGGQEDETKSIRVEAGVPRSILVVDDEEGFREVLVEILASGGHKADSAIDANSALEILTRKTYDLVITDLGMSGLSGWELADAIHKLFPDIRVVMATGWGTDLDRENLTAHHVNSLIGKPFRIDEIMRVVDQVLARPRNEVFVEQD